MGLFSFLFRSLVVDDLHFLHIDDLHTVLLGPLDAALEGRGQEHPGHLDELCEDREN